MKTMQAFNKNSGRKKMKRGGSARGRMRSNATFYMSNGLQTSKDPVIRLGNKKVNIRALANVRPVKADSTLETFNPKKFKPK